MTKVLKLGLLGRVAVSYDDKPLRELASAKAQALLYYLAVTAVPHSRSFLSTLLWGDLPELDARRNLRGVVMKLRQVLEPYLLITHQDVGFNPQAAYWLDVREFQQALAPTPRFGAERPSETEALARLEYAVQLYRGEFLQDFHVRYATGFAEWVQQEQYRLRHQALDAHQSLVAHYLEMRQYEAGITWARRLLELEPLREEGYRQLMRLLALRGQRSAALGQFEQCRTILRQELGVEPAMETAVLYAHIRDGHITLDESPPPTPVVSVTAVSPPSSPRSPIPFVAGPPITHPAQFFGREREIRRLFSLLRQNPLQNAAIIGPRRSGKTSLLHYLRTISTTDPAHLRPGQRTDWLPHPAQYRWVFVDFQDPRLSTREALMQHLLTHMHLPLPTPCRLDDFLDTVTQHLTTPTVVLFDEIGVAIERYPELDDTFWESLRSLATNQVGGNLAFILAAPESPDQLAHTGGLGSPFFNIFGYAAHLGPLTEAEARELLTAAPRPFAESDIAWILTHSGRWPMLLQMLGRERLLALEEGDADDAWRVEALRQIAPFRNET